MMEKREDKSGAKKPEVVVTYKGGGEGHGNPHHVSPMSPVTREAYGGGMYGKDDAGHGDSVQKNKPPASDTQSADGPAEAAFPPKHKPPPSSGDRDIDITGQSYIG